MTSFDPAAAFLLSLPFDNLFEPARADEVNKTTFRCKGCGEIVTIGDREKHHRGHRKETDRETRKRQEQIRRDRVKNLARARAVRK